MKIPQFRSYGFQERLNFSNGHAPDADSIFPFLRHRIPGFIRVRKAAAINDRSGVDYYIERSGLFSLAVDLKAREEDYSVKLPPFRADDLALETFSDLDRGVIGWTRNASKAADYILWFWKDTGRFFIVPFPPLCCVFQRYWEPWCKKYGTHIQTSLEGRRKWRSECVYVPREVVVETIGRWHGGHTRTEKTA